METRPVVRSGSSLILSFPDPHVSLLTGAGRDIIHPRVHLGDTLGILRRLHSFDKGKKKKKYGINQWDSGDLELNCLRFTFRRDFL